MPWFYAGPEAKPVGPVSVEELHACRVRGTISPETYVIEQKAQPGGEAIAWKRYKDVFPVGPDQSSLPPVPAPTLPPPPTPLPSPLPNPTTAQPHPLFPSAAPVPTHYPTYPATPQAAPYLPPPRHPTNGFCAWGFWVGLASFILLLGCGIGILLAPIAFVLCIIGLAQVHAHREQGGQYQAIIGLILSIVAILIGLVVIFAVDMPFMKAHGLTVTEQTSNDSE